MKKKNALNLLKITATCYQEKYLSLSETKNLANVSKTTRVNLLNKFVYTYKTPKLKKIFNLRRM